MLFLDGVKLIQGSEILFAIMHPATVGSGLQLEGFFHCDLPQPAHSSLIPPSQTPRYRRANSSGPSHKSPSDYGHIRQTGTHVLIRQVTSAVELAQRVSLLFRSDPGSNGDPSAEHRTHPHSTAPCSKTSWWLERHQNILVGLMDITVRRPNNALGPMRIHSSFNLACKTTYIKGYSLRITRPLFHVVDLRSS